MTRWIRVALLVLEGFVCLTAVAGGVTLVVATLANATPGAVVPAIRYLEGSPFRSYLIPGALLALVVGGTQGIALALVARRSSNALVATVIAAMGLNIWVFVELVVIPFSWLQVVYFVASLAEIALAMLGLGLLEFRISPRSGLRKRSGSRSE
jgi:hypothetical protein